MTLEVVVYAKKRRVIRLSACPLCGMPFEAGDRRSVHFLEEHDADDVPALADSGGGVRAD